MVGKSRHRRIKKQRRFERSAATSQLSLRSFYPYVLNMISVLLELLLGRLRYFIAVVPPQPNSPPDLVFVVFIFK
ncbi:senescence-associated protein [Anaeramoeba ignava]|uniref:Senescence-associated protein n=1 Tax=Anaeramoeba ignava TaxID=1746090 RepID=A0A9Q0L7T2_ANAIG|nr:senescence-associated protein [Anaeramoeba ignava]